MLETRIRTGLVRGKMTNTEGIVSFLGIPFAAPPVGELRWRAPEKPQPWDGVRDCFDYGYSCWQRDNSQSPYILKCMAENPVKPRPLRMSEDCLYLNVWTPAEALKRGAAGTECAAATGEKLPVMVWFYGGGLQGGTTDDLIFDGEGLCQYGVILVTANYRTGVFGYFGHPDLEKENEHHATGNYGLMDQIAALQWVHDNIEAFGGDPGNVTIFGCSGGGRSVQGLACSPLAEGLIHHAVCHSAGGLNPNYSLPYSKLKARGEEFVRFCGLSTIAEMRALPAEKLQEIYNGFGFDRWFNITGDGWTLPVTMDEMVRQGRQQDLDYILSTTLNEIRWPLRAPVTVANFKDHKFGERTEIFGKSVTPTTDEQATHYAEWCESYEMKAAQLAWAKVQASQPKKPVYLMSYDHPMPGTDLASHGDDQYYVFHTLKKFYFPSTEEDDALSRVMMLRWTNFAKTGSPNAPGLPEWTPFTNDSPLTMTVLSADDWQMKDRSVKVIDHLAEIYAKWESEE